MLSFDVSAYLEQLGIKSNSIDALSGGVINETFRVDVRLSSTSPISSQNPPSWCKGRDAVIFKFAPPYIARIGPAAPFDVRRQEIEASIYFIRAPNPLTFPTDCRRQQLLDFSRILGSEL